jgi:hypothetical protein
VDHNLRGRLMAEKNENCLVGYKCPKCGALGPFKFPTKGWAEWSDDGTLGVTEPEIDDHEGASGECLSCHEWSWLNDFKEQPGEDEDSDSNADSVDQD